MDVQGIVIGVGLFLLGLVVGRLTAPRVRSETVHHHPARGAGGAESDRAVDAEVEALLRAGRKLEAIKRHREAYGLGLREAKDAVEAIEARLDR